MGPCRIQAIGVMKSGPLFELWKDYQKRLRYPIILTQHTLKATPALPEAESGLILKSLKENETLLVLDERGDTFTTLQLYILLEDIYLNNKVPCFALGGAQGHHEHLRHQAHHIISFGAFTWPHMLARVMLIEQLYRIQQIHQGHPYHRP